MSASLSFRNISAAVDVAVTVDDVDASVALAAASQKTIFAPKDLHHQKSKHTFQTLIPINCWFLSFAFYHFVNSFGIASFVRVLKRCWFTVDLVKLMMLPSFGY